MDARPIGIAAGFLFALTRKRATPSLSIGRALSLPEPASPFMTIRADAWVLYAASESEKSRPGKLVRESIELPELGEEDVLAEPLYGCWEGNMGHALQRKPVDVCA